MARQINRGGWNTGVYNAEHHVFVTRYPCTPKHGMALADAQELVDGHLDGYEVKRGRTKRGAAFCNPREKVISLPQYAPRWLVLHEMAHGLAPKDHHGVDFRDAYLKLVEVEMSAWWARRLAAAFKKVGY
jgi:hypothetical protein